MKSISLLSLVLLATPALAQTDPEPIPPPPVPGPEIVEPVPAPAAKKGSPISVVYDGGTIFRTEDEKFELKLGARMQTRYELLQVMDDNDATEATQRFLVPRTRLNLDGHVFTKDIRFKVESAFADNGAPRLRDFYLDVGFLGGKLIFRAGQWKRPFNRQEIVSDFGTEMPEKALTNNFAQGSRDLGFGFHNGLEKSPDGLEWSIGLFNGQGDGAAPRTTCTLNGMTITCTTTASNAPADWQPQLVARVGFNMGGIKGYSEGDLEGGPLRLAVAASYKAMNIEDRDNADLSHAFEADFVLKVAGLSAQGAFLMQKIGDADPQYAGHGQLGYFVTPKQLQVVGRFGMTPLAVPTGGADQEYTMEMRGGFNWYFYGHNLKWSNDIGMVKDTTDNADGRLEARIQAQVIF